MRAAPVIRVSCYIAATALVLFALWCLLWVVSSSSMAFSECAGSYDLFASNPRCRQPSIAGILALASALGAVDLVLVGRRVRS